MKYTVLTVGLACALATGAAQAQQVIGASTVLAPDDNKVTVSGCLLKGQEGGGFLLTEPADTLATTAIKPMRVLYWLEKDDDLEGHAGHKVEVTGELEGEVKKGEIEVEREDGFVKLEVKSGDRKVVARFAEAPAAVGTSGKAGDDDYKVEYVVRKIDVKSVRMLAEGCR